MKYRLSLFLIIITVFVLVTKVTVPLIFESRTKKNLDSEANPVREQNTPINLHDNPSLTDKASPQSPLVNSEAYEELIGESQIRRVEIRQLPGILQTVRVEQVYHVDSIGRRILKSEHAYAVGEILFGITGDTVPSGIESLGNISPLYPDSGLSHYLLSISDADKDSVENTLELLKSRQFSGVLRFAEPNWLVHTTKLPDDVSVQDASQWAVRNQPTGSDINAAKGWDIRTDASSTVVAIVDTGILETHEDLANNLWVNPNEVANNGIDDDNNGVVDDVFGINTILGNGNITDDNGHGTHVAGTIGAEGNNAIGISGVSWAVKLMAIKSLNESGSGLISDIAEGVLYAVDQGAHLINASFGSPVFHTAVREAIAYAEENNVIVVAASGNESRNNDFSPSYPASYALPNIVSIASLDRSGELSSFSNYGKNSVDIAAPGNEILSTYHTGISSYASLNGTSMAAPHVSGVLALLIQEFPEEEYSRYIDRLFQGSSNLNLINGTLAYSSRLDMAKSLSIRDPQPGLRFTNQMPNPIVRFESQAVRLESQVAADSGVNYTWLKDGNSIGVAEKALTINSLRLDDAGVYSLIAEREHLQIRDVSQLNVIAQNVGLSSALESSLAVGTERLNPWSTTSESSTIGSTSLSSAPIENDSTSSLYSYVFGPGKLSFDWRVSSESGFDFLEFLVNGEVIESISGRSSWLHHEVLLKDQEIKILQWRYSKDDSIVQGLDRAFLDHLVWHPEVIGIPLITRNPEDLILRQGDDASLSVAALGENLDYQWFKDGLEISNGNEVELSLTNVDIDDSGVYHVEVFNANGSRLSQLASVLVGDFPVEILSHPSDQTVLEGVPVQLSVDAFGSPPLSYQWYKDNTPINGTNENVLTIDSPTSDDSGSYHVTASNAFSPGGIQSDTASLIVRPPQVGPAIEKQSFNLFVPVGQPAEVFVDASGTGPLAYQWYFMDEAIIGATQSTLRIENVSSTNVGTYFCVVSNLVGEIRSAPMLIALQGNLGDAVEQPLLTWDSNNDSMVRQLPDPSYDGEDAMAITADPDNNLTWVRTWIEGPAEISFWYSLEGNASSTSGRLFFLVDGLVVEELPYSEDFVKRSFILEKPGLREIRWSHISNLQPYNAFIDELNVTPVTLIKNTQSQVSRFVGETYSIELDIVTSNPFMIEWYKNGAILNGVSGPRFFINRLGISDSGTYQAKLINESGSFWSSNFQLNVSSRPDPNATVVFSGIKFEADSPAPWISQSNEILEGPAALKSPAENNPGITTVVQGPISGIFYSKGLNFSATRSPIWKEESAGHGWTKTTFDFGENATYSMTWRKNGKDPGYLEGLEFLPYFSLKSYRTGFSEVTQNSVLRVEMNDTEGVSFQWFKNGIPIAGANENFYIVYYEDVEDISTFFVEVSTDSATRRSKDMVITRLDPEPGQEIFHEEGLYLQTSQDGWKITNLEPTASDGLSLHPGTLGTSDTRLRSFFFGVSGPCIVSFRVRMGGSASSLVIKDSSDNVYTYDSLTDWTRIELPASGPYRHEFNFSHQPTGSENYADIPIFIDDLKFTSTVLSVENVEDEYVSLGAPLQKKIEVPWEEGFTIEWFKDGKPLRSLDQMTKLSISSVASTDEANYSVKLIGPNGEVLLKEFSLFVQQNLYSGALDSEIVYWALSNPLDWKITEIPDATGGQALVSSFDRFSSEEQLDSSELPTIRIQPLFSGPGVLSFRFKFSNDSATVRLLVLVDGELSSEYASSPIGWEEFHINIDNPAPPDLRLVVQADSEFTNNPNNLIIDSIRFEPSERVIDSLRSKFGHIGKTINIEVNYGIPGTELYTYSIHNANKEIMRNSSGDFILNDPHTSYFGNLSLRIEDEKGIISEHPFQLINAPTLGERFSIGGFTMTGEGDPFVEIETTNDSGRSNVARINPRSSDIPTVLEINAQGPISVQFDYKNLNPENSGNTAVFKINGVIQERLTSPNWKTVSYEYTDSNNARIEWYLDTLNPANGGWLFDSLTISQKPIIHSQPEGINALGNSPVLLSADVTSGKNAKYSWIHNGRSLSSFNGPFLPLQETGSDSSGDYALRIQDNVEIVDSQIANVQFQDNVPDEFPPQTWNRYVQNREFFGFSQNSGIDGGPALYFQATGDSNIKPSIGFKLLGPRTIEFIASAPGAVANKFDTTPELNSSVSLPALSAGWADYSILLESPTVHDILIQFATDTLPSSPNYDTTTGWIDRIRVSWIEGHPFTKWLIEHFPEEYNTISDFELLFGDRDNDGISNYIEFATFSSPKSGKLNFWLSKEEGVAEINNSGGVFTPGFNPPPRFRLEQRSIFNFHAPDFEGPQFHYELLFSQNLATWETVPVGSTSIKEVSEGIVLYQMTITDNQIDPNKPLFFRLSISSELYEQLN